MSQESVGAAILIGLGATAFIDVWALFLRRSFGIASLDYCMLGRWILHMPTGVFAHANITKAAGMPGECAVGWAAHYSIGIGFAVLFLRVVPGDWLAHPTLLPALGFGMATVAVPFLTLQPALGLGIASSRTPHPGKARLKSLATHTVFGLGLYTWAFVLRTITRT